MEILVRKAIMILERIKSFVRITPILNVIAKNLKLCGHVVTMRAFLNAGAFRSFLTMERVNRLEGY